MTGLTEEQLAEMKKLVLEIENDCFSPGYIDRALSNYRLLFAEVRRLREAAKGQLVVVNTAQKEREKLLKALNYWAEAFATGRSEPLYVARDNANRIIEELNLGEI